MATATRNLQAIHGATLFLNGISAGGLMSASIDAGYDNIINTSHDGLQFPMSERLTKYLRGTIQCQDWEDAINVFSAAASSYTFYTRETGLATYAQHVIDDPVIHALSINLANDSYVNCTWSFECKAATDDGFSDLMTTTDNTVAPAFIASSRGVKITSATHSASIIHTTGVSVNATGQLLKASTDGENVYTQVEVVNYSIGGSVTFQDTTVAAGVQKFLTLLNNTVNDLVVVVSDSGLVATATLTVKHVLFTTGNVNYDSSGNYQSFTANFIATDNSGTPLTNATAITIE